jgi:hypothetical protein
MAEGVKWQHWCIIRPKPHDSPRGIPQFGPVQRTLATCNPKISTGVLLEPYDFLGDENRLGDMVRFDWPRIGGASWIPALARLASTLAHFASDASCVPH